MKNKTNDFYPYSSIEFTDGAKGDEGGVSILRSGKGKSLTSLIYKYSSHGLSHGHYDKLNINLYDNGNEVLQDYGASRFINIEQKWGGRYLPETKSYAQQSIAHNTVTVDETSHFNGKEEQSEKFHPVKLFSTVGNGKVQAVSVLDDKAYKDVIMHRSVYMISLPGSSRPLIIDLFRLNSSTSHQYDLPFNYMGNLISTNYKLNSFTKSMSTLGTKNGYQHLWKEAEGTVKAPFGQFTFLNERTFYTISSSIDDSVQVFFTRTGANDPNFNLRRDPSYIIRTKGSNKFLVNVVEIHGNFDPVIEMSTNAYPSVTSIEKLQEDENYSAVLITIKEKQLLLVQANKNFDKNASHKFQKGKFQAEWKGPFAVLYENLLIQ